MTNLQTNGSPQLELVRSFLLGIEMGDMKKAGETMHKDYRRITHPQSVGKPVQNKEEYLQHTGELASLWTDRSVCYIFYRPIFLTPG
jgi:hypothetical protein